MAYFWEGDFYKSKPGADIWDGLSLGHTTENAKRGWSKIGEGVGDAWNDVTGKTGARAAKRAGDLQYQATQDALAQQKQMYDQNRADMMPWLDSGKNSLNLLDSLMASGKFDPQQFSFNAQDFQESPGYNYRVGQGAKMVNRNAAAGGGLRSGATDVELMELGQNMGSQEFENSYNRAFNTFGANSNQMNNFFNKLSQLSGRGQTQSQAVGTLGSNFGNSSSNLITGGANAQASGIMGAANAQQQGTQNLLNLLMQGGALAFG